VYGNYNYRIHGFLYTKQNLAPPQSKSDQLSVTASHLQNSDIRRVTLEVEDCM
jgi:hypothetical protein